MIALSQTADATTSKSSAPPISEYLLLGAIFAHLRYCSSEIKTAHGRLGNTVLTSRVKIFTGTSLIIQSHPDGSAMQLTIEALLA
jgi:hypothetical protein